jgi:hypothetical protein
MPGRIFAFLIIFCASATMAHAQDASSDGSDFCAIAPDDLLVVLDGSWTLRQGPPTTMPGTPVPLPAPPPVGVIFNYEPAQHLVHVVSADLTEGIALFPSAPTQRARADALIAQGPPGSAPVGCDWGSLPTIIGTNYYTGWDTGERVSMSGPFCSPLWDNLLGEYVGGVVCTNARPSQRVEGPLNLEMTLVLRFSNANHGAGMVYFEGHQGGRWFGAMAPVEISR